MRALLLLLLLLPACGDDEPKDDSSAPEADTDTDTDADSDSDSDSDSDADADTDADTDLPDEQGWEFDGGWYPLTEDITYCQTYGTSYLLSAGAQRDGSGAAGYGYVYFADLPQPGAYPVIHMEWGSVPAPGEAGLVFSDARDDSWWYSDGAEGTVTVVDGGGGIFDVYWDSSTLYGLHGGNLQTASGWMRCTP